MKLPSIAIYSGSIPSTTFIESLISGISEKGFEIFLFGKKVRDVEYPGNVKLFVTPQHGLMLTLFVLKEMIRLLFKNPKLCADSIKLIWRRKKRLKIFFKEAGVLLPVINNQPDIFHIQWAKTVEKYPELFELLKSRFALSLRGAHINYSPINDPVLAESYRKYFPKIERFHAVSEAIKHESLKYGADINKISVIHSSVSDELLNAPIAGSEMKSAVQLISIGRFHWKKGYHYSLDAVRILIRKGFNVQYSIVAMGEIPEEILFLIDDYELKDNVKIIPGMPHKELIEKLRESDALLLPSVEEGIANVVLEAMAVGIPVVTTDCGGMNEVVKDGVNGYITSVRNPVEFADKISSLINLDKQEKDQLIRNARETMEREFSKEKQVKEFSEFYLSITQ